MHKFASYKLWRDKLIEKWQEQGSKIEWHYLDDLNFVIALRNKLKEEAQEACSAKTREELVAEQVDILEVIDSLCALKFIKPHEIDEVQARKKHERGGFEERKFVLVAQHPENSFAEKHCLAAPEKYPEIL